MKNVLVNKISGWADAKDALQKVIHAAVDLGVEYVQAEVASLALESTADGGCSGVITKDGETLEADKIILSAGAYTAKLLADSAPDRPSLHAGDRIITVAVGEAIAPLSEAMLAVLKDMPVVIQENPRHRGKPARLKLLAGSVI